MNAHYGFYLHYVVRYVLWFYVVNSFSSCFELRCAKPSKCLYTCLRLAFGKKSMSEKWLPEGGLQTIQNIGVGACFPMTLVKTFFVSVIQYGSTTFNALAIFNGALSRRAKAFHQVYESHTRFPKSSGRLFYKKVSSMIS